MLGAQLYFNVPVVTSDSLFTFTTSVTTYNTLDQDDISVWDTSMQINAVPSVEDVCVVLFLFLYCLFFVFLYSVITRLQQSAMDLKKKKRETVLL